MMSKIPRCCRRLRHSSTLPWRSTCGAIIIFLVVFFISQASASFPEVVNNHVEDQQVSVTGGREDSRTLDIIGALGHTKPGDEADVVAAGSGVSTFHCHPVDLRNLESHSELPFAKSLSRRSLLEIRPPSPPPSPSPPAHPPATLVAPAPPPTNATSPSTPTPPPTNATSPPTPAPAPVNATRPPTPAPAPVNGTRPPTPAPAPANGTRPPTPAPSPAKVPSSPTPAPTPVKGPPPPQKHPSPAPIPSPAPSPTSGNSNPPSSSSRGLSSKTVAGISLVVVGSVLFAVFVALLCSVSKRGRAKERLGSFEDVGS